MPKLFRRTTTQVVVLLCALNATSNAQAFDVKTLLVPPSKEIACRALVPLPGDSSASVLEFADAPPPSARRRMQIGYDVTGAPVHVTIRSVGPVKSQWKELQDWGMLMVNFSQKHSARTRFFRGRARYGDVVTLADAAAQLPPGTYVLTPHELEQVQKLSVWLWNHRCTSEPPH